MSGAAESHPFQNVVIGLDGSDASGAAARWLARRVPADATIHAVHAMSPSAELAIAVTQVDWSDMASHAEQELRTTWTEPLRSVVAETFTSVEHDDAADALSAKAETTDASAIVVGPHGSGDKRILGGLTRELLRESPVPLVVAREPYRAPEEPCVLACIGYGKTSAAVVDWAYRYATAQGLPLELFHAVSPRPIFPAAAPEEMLASYLDPDLAEAWAHDRLGELAGGIRATDTTLPIRLHLTHGSVVGQILERSSAADIVVMGRGHCDTFTRNVLGSRTRRVLTHTGASTAVVPRVS